MIKLTTTVSRDATVQVCLRGTNTLHFQVKFEDGTHYLKFNWQCSDEQAEAVRVACSKSTRTSFYGSSTRYAEVIQGGDQLGIAGGFVALAPMSMLSTAQNDD